MKLKQKLLFFFKTTWRHKTLVDWIHTGVSILRLLYHLAKIALSFSTGDVSVEWQTRGISAVAGKDFKQKLGSVLLKSGGTSAEIQVPILDNEIPELTKSLQIYLKNPTGGGMVLLIDPA